MYVEKSSGVNSGSAHLHLFSGQSTVVIARNLGRRTRPVLIAAAPPSLIGTEEHPALIKS